MATMASLCDAHGRILRQRQDALLPIARQHSALRIPHSRRRFSITAAARSPVKAQAGGTSNGIPVPKEQHPVLGGAKVEEGYVGLFVRLLGLDNQIEDREEAVDALWRHSEGGKENVDEIVAFPGCLTLVVTLVCSDRSGAAEAAAGLLRQVSAFDNHKILVAETGAIEEITGLLTRKHPPMEVREQAVHVLWNLSSVPELRLKIANVELLPVLVLMLQSEEQGEQGVAAGVIAKLAQSENLQSLLLEAGVVPKLANILKADLQKVSKVARREARNALLELSRNPDAKVAVIEEGLMFVPIVGAEAYKSLKEDINASSVPQDVNLEHPLGSQDSPFGAGDFLLGLHIGDQGEVDKATQLAMEGQSRLSFLKRLGLLEKDAGIAASKKNEAERKFTILPWWDAIPRIVLILGLEDANYAKYGAEAVADVAIIEDYRQKLAKAGAIPHLVYLLGSGDESVMEAATDAIEKLSISQKVRSAINAFGAVPALVSVLTTEGSPQILQEKVLGALVRLTQTQEEVKAMVRSGNVAGIMDIVESEDVTYEAKAEAENVLREISALKADPRDKVVTTAGGISALIGVLSSGSYSMKQKAAAVLENIAIREVHAVCIVEAGVDSALKTAFHISSEEGSVDDDLWLAICATSRLLGKLLNFKSARDKLDSSSYFPLLSNILKRGAAPMFVKDWVSACLLKLANSTDGPLDLPINKEVTVHETIPRLVEEMKSGTPAMQQAAILQLWDLVSCGFPEYTATIATVGGIFPVAELLGGSQNSEETRAAALSILYSLSMNDENHPAIVAAGAVPFLERLVRSEADGWKLALDLLRLLPV